MERHTGLTLPRNVMMHVETHRYVQVGAVYFDRCICGEIKRQFNVTDD